jgi:hypothetical protein
MGATPWEARPPRVPFIALGWQRSLDNMCRQDIPGIPEDPDAGWSSGSSLGS